jgi:putative hydrolase of the HAD superfamily
MLIRAVLFDLDDTLYPQAQWLRGAWRAVAKAAASLGVDPLALEHALVAVAAEGSDRGRIIDRALAQTASPETPLAPLLDAFRSHAPRSLTPYPGAPDALAELRRELAIGLVSDGDVGIQRAKLRALGLSDAFDVVILSDAYGRELRKPHPAPFQVALVALGVDAEEAVYVGDRPDKDVAGAAAAGMRAIRVRTGEYATLPDVPAPSASVGHLLEAVELITSWRQRGASARDGRSRAA